MALAQLAFVSVPATAPTVVLNLTQPGLISVKRDSFSLGSPSFDGAPYSVGAEYGERMVSFTLQVTGTYTEAMAIMQSVSRQLTQPNPAQGNRNWLMFRWQPSSDPMFLWTFQSSLDPLEWENSGAGIWELPVRLVADGFIIGPPEDIAAFTITNDPTTGTNKQFYTLPTIKGDVETPLMLAQTTGIGITFARQIGPNNNNILASYSLGGGFTHALLARSITELTSGTDTGATVSAAGTNYIGANYKACTFATVTTLTTRLSGAFTTALTPIPGLYRAFLRYTTPTVTGSPTLTLRLGVNSSTTVGYVYGDTITVTLTATGGTEVGYLTDLGVFQIPVRSEAGRIGLEVPASTTVAPDFSIQAGISAVFAVRFDELYLIPVETNYGTGNLAMVAGPSTGAAAIYNLLVYDGVGNAIRPLYDASGTAPFAGIPASSGTVIYAGLFPSVTPGANNSLTWIYENTGILGTSVDDTTVFAGRYYPRYLHARPDAD